MIAEKAAHRRPRSKWRTRVPFVIDTGSAQIFAFTANGQRLVYETGDRTIVTQAVRDALGRILENEDTLQSVMKRVGQIGTPMASAWMWVVPDMTGRLWLRRAECYSSTETSVWEVVDTAGALAAMAQVPRRTRIIGARGDRVVAIRRDSMNVEHVELYRVVVSMPRSNSPNNR